MVTDRHELIQYQYTQISEVQYGQQKVDYRMPQDKVKSDTGNTATIATKVAGGSHYQLVTTQISNCQQTSNQTKVNSAFHPSRVGRLSTGLSG